MGTFYKKLSLTFEEKRLNKLKSFFFKLEVLAIFYSLGILKYFYLKNEPKLINLIAINSVLGIFSYLRRNKKENFFYIVFAAFCLGMLSAKINHLDFNKIEKNIPYVNVTGKIEKIEDLSKNKKISLSNLYFSQEITPNLEKIVFFAKKSDTKELTQGDIINVNLNLRKYSFPIIFTKTYLNILQYNDQIGAVGFAYSKPIVRQTSENKGLMFQIENFRKNFSNYIKSKLKGDEAAIVNALSIGERGDISEEVNNDIRNSGLSHLLSISGMHLSIVVGIFFLVSRHILNLISLMTNDFNSKKIAAYFSILGSLVYLLISGMKVATIRAYIMSNIGLLAIITGNFYNLTRAIFLSMIILLSFKPIYILSPAFQLSFAAVISIDAYLRTQKNKYFVSDDFGLIRKIFAHLINNTMFTLASTLGGFWICIFHFYQFPNYSIISNLLAVPLTSFAIMPLIIVILFSYFFSCEIIGDCGVFLLKYAVKILAKIAHIVGNLKYSLLYFGEISGNLALLGVFSWLIVVFIPKRASYIVSFIINLVCVSYIFLRSKPDLIIDSESNNIVMVRNDLIFYTNNSYSSFKKKI